MQTICIYNLQCKPIDSLNISLHFDLQKKLLIHPKVQSFCLEKNAFYIEKAGFPKDFLTLFHEIARIQHTKISLGWRPTICWQFMGYLSLRPNEVEISVIRVSGLKGKSRWVQGQFLVTQTPNWHQLVGTSTRN